ncbi:MAG: hypothetical protein ACPHER_00720, partial [Nevskiales bacterium]
ILPEEKRLAVVSSIKFLAADTPDSGFLRKDIRILMSAAETKDTLEHVRKTLLPELSWHIDTWRDNYNREEDPESYMDDLSSTLKDFREAFENDDAAIHMIDRALNDIDILIDDLQSEHLEEPHDEDYFQRQSTDSHEGMTRSIFEDVDG